MNRSPQAPLVINLWATWCQPCLTEIVEWSQHHQEFSKAGVRCVLLNVDESTETGPVNSAQIRELLERLEFPFSAGFATSDLLDALDITQQTSTKRIRALPVPSTFLVDSQGRLAVLYKGPVSAGQLLSDVGNLSAPVKMHRELAVPFPGRWYTNPFPADLFAIPRKYVKLGQSEQAFRYLNRIAPAALDNPVSKDFMQAISTQGLAEEYLSLAASLQVEGKLDLVIESLEAAAQLRPNDSRPRLALATIFQQSGRQAEAALQYRHVLNREPGNPLVANNFSWLLATCADPSVRSPSEAIKLAEDVCKKSRRQLPSALDTLAAAYAAAGRFKDAVSTINEAIALQRSKGPDARLRFMEQRLALYKQNRPFIDVGGK